MLLFLISHGGFPQAPEKLSLPPKPSVPPSSSGSGGASLHQGSAGLRSHSPSVDARVKNEHGAATLEELRAQLRDLKGTVELMKSQHKYELGQGVRWSRSGGKFRRKLDVGRTSWLISVKCVFILKCVFSDKKSNSWWVNWMRRRGFV